jgi:hypothetical protein
MAVVSVVRKVGLALLLWLSVCLPAMAQGVGAIGGTVTDTSGAVLPGVTLTLSSPGVIGNGQTAVSDGSGAYEFTRLVPGRYSVKAELEGFQSAVHENIDVNADRTSRADWKLAVGSVSETLTVTGAAPLLDTTSATKQTVMTREILDSIPTGNDVWSITRLAPAVLNGANFDVGGRGMFEQGQALVHGSLVREQGYLMDGLDVTSPQEGSANIFFDTFGAQELNVQAGQTPAEQGKGGVLMNLITKTGTNKVSGAGMFQGANKQLESNNITDPELREQLLAGVPAAALAANPSIEPGSALQHMFDSGVTLGGPVIHDRLWYYGSARHAEMYRYQVGSYNADGSQLLDDNWMNNLLGKGSWAVSSNGQLHSTITWNQKARPHQNGSSTTQFSDTRATQRNDARAWVGITRYTHVISSHLVADVAVEWQTQHNDKLPQPDVLPGDVSHFDAVTNTITVASGTYGSPTQSDKQQTSASLSYVAGSHEFKFGHQYVRSVRKTFFLSTSDYPAGLQAIYRNGVPDSVKTFNTPTGSSWYNTEQDLYVQDKWRIGRKLTANLGLRFEHDFERVNDGTSPLCQTETKYIAGQCFPAISGVPNLNFLAPRFSAIYDLFGDGTTALKFVANRYIMQQIGQSTLVNPIKLTSDTRSWIDTNGDALPQLNELGPSTGFNLGTTNRLDPNIKVPYANELGAEVEQQLPGQVVVSAGYHYRGRRNVIGAVNVAVPTDSYIPLTVTEVSSGRQVTVYNQNPALRGKFDVLYSNHRELDDSFNGLDVTVQKRMAHHWMVMGSLSLATTEGDINTVNGQNAADLNNPNFTFRRGPDIGDVPRYVKIAGAYELPYGLKMGASAQYYQGQPLLTTVRVASDTVKLTQNTQVIAVEPFGADRLPSISTVDFNLTKSLRRGGIRIEPRMDIFNLFNAAAITDRIGQLGPSYGNAITLLGSRLIKFGVNVTF